MRLGDGGLDVSRPSRFDVATAERMSGRNSSARESRSGVFVSLIEIPGLALGNFPFIMGAGGGTGSGGDTGRGGLALADGVSDECTKS